MEWVAAMRRRPTTSDDIRECECEEMARRGQRRSAACLLSSLDRAIHSVRTDARRQGKRERSGGGRGGGARVRRRDGVRACDCGCRSKAGAFPLSSAVVGQERASKRQGDLSSRPIQKKKRKREETENEAAAAAAIHDGPCWWRW